MIEIDIKLTLPSFVLETKIDLPSQGVTALFGSSGSGKSTLLRCIAGLNKPQLGRLVINGEVWQDDKTFLPPHQRPVGMVFQDAALFPHLNVQQNLDYGARRSKIKTSGLERLIENTRNRTLASAPYQCTVGRRKAARRHRTRLVSLHHKCCCSTNRCRH